MSNFSNIFYFTERGYWRDWLEINHKNQKEIWLIYPRKESGKPRILYNDAVEEALCFGWIDSTMKTYDETSSMQRFTPRNPKSTYSQLNKERIKWLAHHHMIIPEVREQVQFILEEKFIYPKDILKAIREEPQAWENYQSFSDSYKRIRIAYIDGARMRPEEFEKRLHNFIKHTRQNKLIRGYGGTEKYY